MGEGSVVAVFLVLLTSYVIAWNSAPGSRESRVEDHLFAGNTPLLGLSSSVGAIVSMAVAFTALLSAGFVFGWQILLSIAGGAAGLKALVTFARRPATVRALDHSAELRHSHGASYLSILASGRSNSFLPLLRGRAPLLSGDAGYGDRGSAQFHALLHPHAASRTWIAPSRDCHRLLLVRFSRRLPRCTDHRLFPVTRRCRFHCPDCRAFRACANNISRSWYDRRRDTLDATAAYLLTHRGVYWRIRLGLRQHRSVVSHNRHAPAERSDAHVETGSDHHVLHCHPAGARRERRCRHSAS